MKIGILALQGDVSEHIAATKKAAEKLKLNCEVIKVKEKKDFENLDALIIPGGESTTLIKLIEREDLIQDIKKVKNIFGTCAGMILLSQNNLGLIDVEVERNAYGSQLDSFEQEIETKLGKTNGIFIRAPKVKKIGTDTKIIARDNGEVVGVEQKKEGRYYLALAFHPELSTTKFHEYFLENMFEK